MLPIGEWSFIRWELYSCMSSSVKDLFGADFLLVNGKILTIDANDSIVEAVAFKGDRIVATGSTTEMKKLAAKGAKMSIVDHQSQRLFERHTAVQGPPVPIVPHPVDVETIRAHIVQARKRRVKFVTDSVGRV